MIVHDVPLKTSTYLVLSLLNSWSLNWRLQFPCFISLKCSRSFRLNKVCHLRSSHSLSQISYVNLRIEETVLKNWPKTKDNEVSQTWGSRWPRALFYPDLMSKLSLFMRRFHFWDGTIFAKSKLQVLQEKCSSPGVGQRDANHPKERWNKFWQAMWTKVCLAHHNIARHLLSQDRWGHN